jgi:anti-sigma regulatory factor (Ser/Thr protein kinase)
MDLSPVPRQVWTQVQDASQVGEARRQAQALCRLHEVDEVTAGSVAIVATELATNVLRHGGGGHVLAQRLYTARGPTIELLSLDRGPGMPDVGRCLQDGFSTGGTAGTGLGAVQRLADEFDVFSAPGQGTVVLARLVGPDAAPQATNARWGAMQLCAPGESLCGDTWHMRADDGVMRLVVVDGLGHGPLAAEAARQAARACEVEAGADPETLLDAIHRHAHGTRGAAAAVCRIDLGSGRVRFAGVGNISATILAPGSGGRGLMSHNGILGVQVRRIQAFDHDFPASALLVMHSDGLQTRWNLDDYPGLRQRHPATIAALLARDFLRGRDDATVVALRRAA